MKTKNIIQRLCLFLFALMLALSAVATNYDREGYETFRSRELGQHKNVTFLKKGKVEITFSSCTTSGSSGNGAIYQPAKGSRITVKADDGYSIRWIILRDTEGGERYSHPKGKYRISSVTSGYDYYFERNAISNSRISGANQNNLNDDDNNIVVYQYDASAQSVEIRTHNNRNWDQFKVRDIIVGYVKSPSVVFDRPSYDVYTVSDAFTPTLDTKGYYGGTIGYKVNNNNIAEVNSNGTLKLKGAGTVDITATFPSTEKFAKMQCSTRINVMRDRVTFNYQVTRPKVLYYQGDGYGNPIHNLYDYSDFTTESGIPYNRGNDGFNIECTNSDVLSIGKTTGRCFFEGTAGTVTVTMTQHENNLYAESSLRQTFTVIRTDKGAKTMLIKDANEWKLFCKLVNDKGMTGLNARLETDVDLGGDIAMVGTTSHPYAGTFDGQNHTLKFNWNGGSDSDIAPFKKVGNATIKNLRTEGTIKSNSYYLSGLVGDAYYGTVNISNCASNVNITSSHTGGICDAAGMISYIDSRANVAITDCLVEGNITAMTDEGKKRMSGFVFYQYGTCTLTNCLYIGENNADNTNGDSNTFANNATVTNCYYLNTCGTTQGDRVTEEQLKSGYVAYNLQNGRNNMVWGQDLNKDTEPLLTADGAKRVRKVEFTYNNRVKATRYATHGNAIYGGMPTFTAKDLLGSDYNEHHYYSGIAFEDGFNGSTTVNTDRTVALTFNKKDYYEIATKEDWKAFCDIVKSGQNAVDAKLTRNIDLGSEINMVGNDNNKYSGTFDGQNHTLKLDWSNTNVLLAPFYRVENTTIRNLRTEGNIKSSYSLLSGLILTVYGKTTITNCVSAVNITSTYNGSGCVIAGMILEIPYGAVVTFTDCIVKGKYNTTLKEGSISVSGFISGHNGTSTFNNCIYLGDNVPGGGYTFAAYTYLGPTLNNCYYLNACGKAQGTKITAEQLKSGEVTKKLQNNRTDKCYWAQQLGEMPDFYNAADKSKANYVYYDAAKKGWTCDDFRLTDGTAMPIGLDFTAATVTYERNFNGAQKATLCLPYDLYAQGFKAYTLSGGNKNEVHFKEVDDKLPAYTPYYITANGMPQLGGRNIEVKAYKADKMTTLAAGYKFTGTVAGVSNATAAAANAYILQDDGKFHKVTTANSAATIPAYRAYIICPPQASGAKQLSVVLDGETTGIGNVTNEATDGKNGPVYDLQGRRVADRLDDARHRLPAGVYIVGGRKVVVK